MLTSLSHTFIYVLDHDEAVDFYVGKLGLEIGTDADLGPFRWLTVQVPGKSETVLVLATPDMGHDEETAAAIRELVTKGGGSGVIFNVDDCRKTYEELTAKGVEFVSEPADRPYGVEAVMRDNSGNWLVLVESKPYSGEDFPH